MTTWTRKDRDNMAAIVAVHANKAQSYETCLSDRMRAKRQKEFVATLEKARAIIGEKEGKEGTPE